MFSAVMKLYRTLRRPSRMANERFFRMGLVTGGASFNPGPTPAFHQQIGRAIFQPVTGPELHKPPVGLPDPPEDLLDNAVLIVHGKDLKPAAEQALRVLEARRLACRFVNQAGQQVVGDRDLLAQPLKP